MIDPHRSSAERLRPRWRTRLAAILMLGSLLAPQAGTSGTSSPAPDVSADTGRALERRVKAAFLFRFAEFVTWPDEALPRANSPFIIAVAGRENFIDELRQVTAGRSLFGHAVEVRRVSDAASMPHAQIVFIPDAEKQRLREWVRMAPRSALIVTESDDALDHGSVINFALAAGRVRFEISLENAEKRRLRLSSRLLALALQVRTGAP